MTTHYGLIGAGMMGREHIQNIKLLPDTHLAGFVEPDDNMAAATLALVPGARRMESIGALLALAELDCLVIASPNFRHVEQLRRIANLRPLPTLVEKPLVTEAGDIAFVRDLETGFGAPIWVAMEYRYMPPIAALCERAPAATGGVQMLSIREHRFPFLEKVGDWNRFNRYSGGTFVEKCCHFFDLMRLVMGSEAVRVVASAGQAVNHLHEQYAGETPDILDHGYVIVDFENNARAMLELCMFAEGARYQEEISAVGAAGKIECHVPGPGRFWPAHLGQVPTPRVIESPRQPRGPHTIDTPVHPVLLQAGDHNGSTFYQHKGFLELVRGERQHPAVSVTDGIEAVRLGMAAQQSAATGQVVSL